MEDGEEPDSSGTESLHASEEGRGNPPYPFRDIDTYDSIPLMLQGVGFPVGMSQYSTSDSLAKWYLLSLAQLAPVMPKTVCYAPPARWTATDIDERTGEIRSITRGPVTCPYSRYLQYMSLTSKGYNVRVRSEQGFIFFPFVVQVGEFTGSRSERRRTLGHEHSSSFMALVQDMVELVSGSLTANRVRRLGLLDAALFGVSRQPEGILVALRAVLHVDGVELSTALTQLLQEEGLERKVFQFYHALRQWTLDEMSETERWTALSNSVPLRLEERAIKELITSLELGCPASAAMFKNLVDSSGRPLPTKTLDDVDVGDRVVVTNKPCSGNNLLPVLVRGNTVVTLMPVGDDILYRVVRRGKAELIEAYRSLDEMGFHVVTGVIQTIALLPPVIPAAVVDAVPTAATQAIDPQPDGSEGFEF